MIRMIYMINKRKVTLNTKLQETIEQLKTALDNVKKTLGKKCSNQVAIRLDSELETMMQVINRADEYTSKGDK